MWLVGVVRRGGGWGHTGLVGVWSWRLDLRPEKPKYTMARQLVEMLPYTVYYSLISLKV